MFIGFDVVAVYSISDLSGTCFPTWKRQHFNLHQLTPPMLFTAWREKCPMKSIVWSHLLVWLVLFLPINLDLIKALTCHSTFKKKMVFGRKLRNHHCHWNKRTHDISPPERSIKSSVLKHFSVYSGRWLFLALWLTSLLRSLMKMSWHSLSIWTASLGSEMKLSMSPVRVKMPKWSWIYLMMPTKTQRVEHNRKWISKEMRCFYNSMLRTYKCSLLRLFHVVTIRQ